MKLVMQRCEEESYVKMQHAISTYGRVYFSVRREVLYSYGALYRAGLPKFICTLMRENKVPHLIET